MNLVLRERIVELSEVKTRFEKLKKMGANWRAVCFTAIVALTMKVAAEQLAMIFVRRH